MREVISSPKPRPQRSSHLHIRTKYGVVRPKEAPSSTFKPPSYSHKGGHKHAMREAISMQ